ncbi:signal recognition particle receptor subunit alpha-like [Corticium candelabrum]|uniref:signal recognition particle receptor subunit alpha-like n=1 Tax=Corticium candelabrum TaxID=121492 RepID=UPI002E26CC78|nr:signal recognition particle receptor subunit alpha-like [Corticium candelabrum]
MAAAMGPLQIGGYGSDQVCFWLLDNGYRVLVSACDTFRAGAVEQLRTHHRSLAAIRRPDNETNPPRVMLYEKGHGKDAASIAMDSIRYARDAGFDVVLIDTAGRMQDNEPLMRALAKDGRRPYQLTDGGLRRRQRKDEQKYAVLYAEGTVRPEIMKLCFIGKEGAGAD